MGQVIVLKAPAVAHEDGAHDAHDAHEDGVHEDGAHDAHVGAHGAHDAHKDGAHDAHEDSIRGLRWHTRMRHC